MLSREKHTQGLGALCIAADEHNPKVRFNERGSLIWLTGKCDAPGQPKAIIWACEISKKHLQCNDHLQVVLDLQLVNASAVKALMNYLNSLKRYLRQGKEVKINWLISLLDDEMFCLAVGLLQLYELAIEIETY